MRAVTDPIAKSWFSTVYSELNVYEHFKTLFKFFYGIRPPNPGSDAPFKGAPMTGHEGPEGE